MNCRHDEKYQKTLFTSTYCEACDGTAPDLQPDELDCLSLGQGEALTGIKVDMNRIHHAVDEFNKRFGLDPPRKIISDATAETRKPGIYAGVDLKIEWKDGSSYGIYPKGHRLWSPLLPWDFKNLTITARSEGKALLEIKGDESFQITNCCLDGAGMVRYYIEIPSPGYPHPILHNNDCLNRKKGSS